MDTNEIPEQPTLTDEEYIKKQRKLEYDREYRKRPEVIERNRIRSSQDYQKIKDDVEYQRKRKEYIKDYYHNVLKSDPERFKKHIESGKKYLRENKEKLNQKTKERMQNDPEFLEKQREYKRKAEKKIYERKKMLREMEKKLEEEKEKI